MATNTIYYPSLSEDGWVRDSLQKADYLFGDFFVANYSQTVIYPGKVSSLPYIIQQYSGDPNSTAEALEKQLIEYFSEYFPNVECQVTYPTGQASSRVFLNIVLAFQDPNTGAMVSITKVATLQDSKVVNIENLNNYGSEDS